MSRHCAASKILLTICIYILANEMDIIRVLQELRSFSRLMSLKLPLSNDERAYVKNNRFKKLQLSKSCSDENDE
mgnify:CR=1 FL=1